MVLYGLAMAGERGEVVDWYATAAEAARALRDVLTDEPEWRGLMSVLEVDFAAETATVVLR